MFEIRTVRTVASEDLSHRHIDLVGVWSIHIQYEPIMLTIPRLLQRMELGEEFFVTTNEGPAKVIEAKCEVCGYAPYVKTEKDAQGRNLIVELPES
jgi:hypothetical protein